MCGETTPDGHIRYVTQIQMLVIRSDAQNQVLFTSDLKSFADYGTGKQAPVNGTGLLTPEDTPEPNTTTKRKRGRTKVEVMVQTTSGPPQEVTSAAVTVEEVYDNDSSTPTLAERVKRRRRTKHQVTQGGSNCQSV